jgi:heme exporter protein B
MRSVIARDLKLALRSGGGFGQAVGFYLILVVLIPFGVGQDQQINGLIAAGVLWIGALLSALLTLERLFQIDYEDGTLDALASSPIPLEAVCLGKMVVHWVTVMVPLICVAPVLAVLLNLPQGAYGVLLLSLIVGTPSLSALGVFGAALTVGIKRGGLLLSLLVLPLYIPTLILGADSVRRAIDGISYETPLILQLALSLVCVACVPFIGQATLRVNLK